MTQPLYILCFFLLFFSCKGKGNDIKSYNFQADIRLGNKFYSIYLNEDGEGYVIKGSGSYYTDTLKIKSSDTSNVFKIDSVKVFFENLNKIKAHPIVGVNRVDAPRVEIYYNHQKVYDAYKWDETFWKLFRPIMEQIPRGFNPFRANDKPFSYIKCEINNKAPHGAFIIYKACSFADFIRPSRA